MDLLYSYNLRIDPSHGTGKLSVIEPMSLAAMAAGADGILIEVHYNPSEALSDKERSMPPDMFKGLMNKLQVLRTYMDEIGQAVTL